MSATLISARIRTIVPGRADVVVVANHRLGTLTLLVEVGGKMSTLKFDTAGWNAIHAGVGVPPLDHDRKTTAGRPLFPAYLNPSAARHA